MDSEYIDSDSEVLDGMPTNAGTPQLIQCGRSAIGQILKGTNLRDSVQRRATENKENSEGNSENDLIGKLLSNDPENGDVEEEAGTKSQQNFANGDEIYYNEESEEVSREEVEEVSREESKEVSLEEVENVLRDEVEEPSREEVKELSFTGNNGEDIIPFHKYMQRSRMSTWLIDNVCKQCISLNENGEIEKFHIFRK